MTYKAHQILVISHISVTVTPLTQVLSDLDPTLFQYEFISTPTPLDHKEKLTSAEAILLDVATSELGISWLNQLQHILPQVPIIVVVDDYLEQDALDAIEIGAQDYLNKAKITPKALGRIIRSAIQRQKLIQTNRQLLGQIQGLSSRIAVVNEVAMAINQSLKLDEILFVVRKQAKWLLDFDHFSLCLQNRQNEWSFETMFGPVIPFDIQTILPTEPLALALKTGFPQVVRQRPPQATFLPDYASQLIIPLRLNRQIRGSLNFARTLENAYTQEDLRIGYLLALQLDSTISNSYNFSDLTRLNQELVQEKQKSDSLLLNIMPDHIATELKNNGRVVPVYHPQVTIMFTDFKGFTQLVEQMSPQNLVAELDFCFKSFDRIIEKHGLEKLKTIGDAYMCACGVPLPQPDHALKTIQAALEIQDFMVQRRLDKLNQGQSYWEIRIGLHSGPLIAGVIGEKKFVYDVWGDAVNLAARMESSGVPGHINISQDTYQLVKDEVICEYRGKIPAKNKGEVDMYLVHGLNKK